MRCKAPWKYSSTHFNKTSLHHILSMGFGKILTNKTGEKRFSSHSTDTDKFSGNDAEQLGRAMVLWVDLCLNGSWRALEIILLKTL